MTVPAYPLRGRARHYPWGGNQFIPNLLGRQADGRPWAEYWLGAHPGDPADILLDGQWQPLSEMVTADPCRWLGEPTALAYGELPYLMKVLDVGQPLSIQVHPNQAQAKAGYAAENGIGLALDDPSRNFKDANPKPELALALSDFWLLYGFRPVAAIQEELAQFPHLQELSACLDSQGLKSLFRTVMSAPQEQLKQWLNPLFKTAGNTVAPPDRALYWIRQWCELHDHHQAAIDRGIFGFLLMNLVMLRPGETIFQDANVPHAYLSGQCAEIMANSDNVLRGGLTPKHVDVPALIDHIEFVSDDHIHSAPPATLTAFSLRQVHNTGDSSARELIHGPACVLVLSGTADLDAFSADRGHAFFVPGAQIANPSLEPGTQLLVGSPSAALTQQ